MDAQITLASGQKEKSAGESDIVSLLNRAQLKYDMKCGNQGSIPSQPPRSVAVAPPPIAKPVPVAISSLMQTAAGVSACNDPFIQQAQQFSSNQQPPTNQTRTPTLTSFSALTGLANKENAPIDAKMLGSAENNQSHVTRVGSFEAGVPNLLQRLLAAPKIGDGLVADLGAVSGVDVPSPLSPPSLALHSSASVPPRPIVGQQQQQPQRHQTSPSPNSFSSANSNSAFLSTPSNGAVFLQTPKRRTPPPPDHVTSGNLCDPNTHSVMTLLTPASLGGAFNDLGGSNSTTTTNNEASCAVQGNNATNRISPSSSTGLPSLNENAFIAAFCNLMRTDKNFCLKLHQEYMRSLDHYLSNSMNN